MDKTVVDINFPEASNLEDRMLNVADSLATSLDHHHICGGSCTHRPTLHIRVNDTNSGKGIDKFYALSVGRDIFPEQIGGLMESKTIRIKMDTYRRLQGMSRPFITIDATIAGLLDEIQRMNLLREQVQVLRGKHSSSS